MHITLGKTVTVVLAVLSLILKQSMNKCFMRNELEENLQVGDQIWHMKENHIIRRNKEKTEKGQQLSGNKYCELLFVLVFYVA